MSVYSHSSSLNYVSPRIIGVDDKSGCDCPLVLIFDPKAFADAADAAAFAASTTLCNY